MAPSSHPPTRGLHPWKADLAVQRGTYRLYAQGRPVGLAKRVGGCFFYSRDGGFAWTGHKLEADAWAIASSLRDRKD